MAMHTALSACVLLGLLSFQSARPQTSAKPSPIDESKKALALSGLQELPGKVPTRYVPGAQSRAAEYQKSLEAAQAWFSSELGVSVPTTLFVLDKDGYGRLGNGDSWPTPYSHTDKQDNVVIFPSHIEEMVGEESKAKLPGEYILFHETGHNFAHRLGIDSGNSWVNELIANMFMAAYIQENRPDLMWVSEGPTAHDFALEPHFTSLRDLDYLYYQGVAPANYVWYQLEIQVLAQLLVKDQAFSEVVRRLKAAFPEDARKQETFEQITAHLNTIRSGAANVLQSLYGPSIVRQVHPVACELGQQSVTTHRAVIAVRNDTLRDVVVESSDGRRRTVAAAHWATFVLPPTGILKLSNNTCILAEDTSVLAVVTEP